MRDCAIFDAKLPRNYRFEDPLDARRQTPGAAGAGSPARPDFVEMQKQISRIIVNSGRTGALEFLLRVPAR